MPHVANTSASCASRRATSGPKPPRITSHVDARDCGASSIKPASSASPASNPSAARAEEPAPWKRTTRGNGAVAAAVGGTRSSAPPPSSEVPGATPAGGSGAGRACSRSEPLEWLRRIACALEVPVRKPRKVMSGRGEEVAIAPDPLEDAGWGRRERRRSLRRHGAAGRGGMRPCRGSVRLAAGDDAELGEALVGGAFDHDAGGGELLEVVDDLGRQPLAGRDDRDARRVRADHLGGDAAGRLAPGDVLGGAQEGVARQHDGLRAQRGGRGRGGEGGGGGCRGGGGGGG